MKPGYKRACSCAQARLGGCALVSNSIAFRAALRRPVRVFSIVWEHSGVKTGQYAKLLHIWRQAKNKFSFFSLSLDECVYPRRCASHVDDEVRTPVSSRFTSCFLPPSYIYPPMSRTRRFRAIRRSREARLGLWTRPGLVSDSGGRLSVGGSREGLGRAGGAVPGLSRLAFSSVGQGALVAQLSLCSG